MSEQKISLSLTKDEWEFICSYLGNDSGEDDKVRHITDQIRRVSNRAKRHDELVQWYMDCNGYTRSHPVVDEYIDELNDMSDRQFNKEYEYCLGED